MVNLVKMGKSSSPKLSLLSGRLHPRLSLISSVKLLSVQFFDVQQSGMLPL